MDKAHDLRKNPTHFPKIRGYEREKLGFSMLLATCVNINNRRTRILNGIDDGVPPGSRHSRLPF